MAADERRCVCVGDNGDVRRDEVGRRVVGRVYIAWGCCIVLCVVVCCGVLCCVAVCSGVLCCVALCWGVL